MSSQSIPLRNLPTEVVAIADAIAQQSGLSLADVYRLALASGVLVEATKITPDRAGTYAGLDGASLAKALRRHLASAIDLLAAYDEHPHAAWLSPIPASERDQQRYSPDEADAAPLFDADIGNDLESLGIGLGLREP